MPRNRQRFTPFTNGGRWTFRNRPRWPTCCCWYASELIGDHTLVTVNLDGSHIVMKMPKEFEADFDKTVGIRFAAAAGYLFDADTGMRIAASIAQ